MRFSGECRLAPLFWCMSLLVHLTSAHHLITYPGTRGNNLGVNTPDTPFGMQWMYPCGGLSVTRNRTAWPVSGGGGIAVQPGWFVGHKSSLFYINMGLGADPQNYSFPMLGMFRVTTPSNNPNPGTFCLPQVPLPAGFVPKSGDFASIQVVQTHVHGAPAFSCADIVFTDDPAQVPPLSQSNCFNSTDVTVEHVMVVPSNPRPAISTGTSTETPGPSTTSGLAPPPTNEARRLSSRFSGLLGLLAML